MNPPRIYADTSVFGGCLDGEFAAESREMFAAVRKRKMILLLSDILADELSLAPAAVQALADELPERCYEIVTTSPESVQLRDAYIRARVVTAKHHRDAHHVALATVSRADVVASWNFKHIVHWDKVRLFNAVNLRNGYTSIDIRSPRELV